MRIQFEEHIDNEPLHEETWKINRRKWLKTALLGCIALQLPWISSCESLSPETKYKDLDGKGVFSISEMKSIVAIQNILIPEDGNGPSAYNVNAHNYFVWTLLDERADSENKSYFKDKLSKLLSISKEDYQLDFYQLSTDNQKSFISKMATTGWSRSFLSRMITIIFEAMLFDPIYNINPKGIGWKWLDLPVGFPQPTNTTKYPDFLQTVNSQYG